MAPTADAPTVLLDTPEVMVQVIEYPCIPRPQGSGLRERTDWLMVKLPRRAIEEACAKGGLSALRIGPYPPKKSSGAVAADAVLRMDATAFIAFSDLLAIGMLQRFKARGVRVPRT